MKIPLYQIDAFTGRVFGGNPAAVCPLDAWLPDPTMQSIGLENNVSETAFIVPQNGDYAIRWFTPACEVDLCGHATLASGYAIFNILEPSRTSVTFSSKSGPLHVTRQDDTIILNFPARAGVLCDPPAELLAALNVKPEAVYKASDYMAVFKSEAEIRALRPDMAKLAAIDGIRAFICTAPGDSVDFVSRFFAPKQGINEDPVTGSAHCTLIPYWSKRLGRNPLRALQLSARGGELYCEDLGDRVAIAGRAALYLEGAIHI
ncbi:MAG: PhzF family phenazine biosynthesis protein [Candidatus Eremiobacteraeota bacterium]|nr:PhzF family phenazine biosynthesis protein [Candidatus Eremiobacteraeota bacterium]